MPADAVAAGRSPHGVIQEPFRNTPPSFAVDQGTSVNVTDAARAEGRFAAEISGHAVVLAVGDDGRTSIGRHAGDGARIAAQRALRHLQTAAPHRLRVRSDAEVGALVGPFDLLVAVAIVPSV